jgi:hypothetical protein
MMQIRRRGSWRTSLLALLLGAGCAIEEPYAAWTTPPAPSPPLSVQDVIKFLKVGISEDAILAKVRRDGIDARPTAAELRALRDAGASDRLIAALLAAASLNPPEVMVPSEAEFQIHYWPPVHPFPGLWPFTDWTLQNGKWHPWFYRHLP